MRQERAELTRQTLTMAAAEAFDRFGYERTTLLDVSRAACVSRGALSFHFGSKDELAETVRREACNRSLQATEMLRAQGRGALQTLIDLTHLVAHQLAYDPLAKAAVQLARELQTPPSPRTDPLACWRQALTDVARQAEKDGALTAGADAKTVAELAFRLACGGHVEQATDAVHQHLAELWRMLLPSLTGDHRQLRSEGTEMERLQVEATALAG